MKRVVHFEIHASDPQRAGQFYKDTFWWDISKWDEGEYWMVKTWDDKDMWINGWLEKWPIWGWFTCVIWVDSVDNFLKKIVENWGSVTKPKAEVWKMWFVAYALDSEGNTFWIFESTMEM